jgi:TRAP-type mannitol/chloroaromatic compound transport system permease small subunit
MTDRFGLERLGHLLMKIGAWPGRAAAWLIIPMTAMVLAAVIGSQMKVGQIARWQTDLPVFGTNLTLNGLAELQWHMLAILVMLGISFAMTQDRHVKVDLIYDTLSPRIQAIIVLLGDLIFLMPFCIIIGWLSIGFVEFSYRTGEKSDYGGLVDRYMIKSVIPIGLALLGLTGIGRILVNLSRAIGWSSAPSRASHD